MMSGLPPQRRLLADADRLPLESVVVPMAELSRRPARAPDHEAENRAIIELMDTMANAVGIAGADRVLQQLVESAALLCRSHSAGVSLLEKDGEREIFRWRAATGEWAKFLGRWIPRQGSPCGTVLERNMTMLMAYPERHYGGLVDAPPIAELLLIPFHHEGKPVGTVWAIAHDEARRFDGEDHRVITSLSRFAAAAYQLLVARELKSRPSTHFAPGQHVSADADLRQRTEVAERRTQELLEAELADSRLLQQLSAELINQDDDSTLYEKVVDAMTSVMQSDYASMQVFVDAADGPLLQLFAHRGLSAEMAARYAVVRDDMRTTCAESLRCRKRVIVPDMEQCDFMAGSEDLELFRRAGVRSAQTTPLLSRSGALVGMVSTGWLHPNQPTERDLRLLDILARQAADLIERRKADEALRQADRRKDEFLATLAHELRNPLAPIRNAIQILNTSRADGADSEWALGVIDRQTQQLTRLVDDLLDVSRITYDKLELRLERIELAKVVQSAIEASRPVIAERGHELVVTLPDRVIVDADPTRLAQVFANLLNNAAKYSELRGRIELRAERVGGDVRVRVRDSGIGIEAGKLSHIFDLFNQVQPSMERIPGGLGIGLTLVKRLVEMHGGQVHATSEGIGKGSEFVVRLPVVRSDARPRVPPDDTPKRASGACRVLVVDDYQDVAVSTGRMLGLLGYETRVASDAGAALEAAREFRPDIALLDIGMPHVNGYELARLMRAEPWGAEIVLIAVTGWGQETDKQRSFEAGFNLHLVKPVDPTELHASTRLRQSSEKGSCHTVEIAVKTAVSC